MRAPEPTILKSDLAIERYKSHMSDLVPRLADEYRNSATSLMTRLQELHRLTHFTAEQRLITALHDESTVHATPLFRYCSARQAHLSQVADHYRAKAVTEYALLHEHYDQAWPAGTIPEELRHEAAQLRKRLEF